MLKPVLLFPHNIEQLLLATNVAALGSGITVLPQALGTGLDAPVASFIEDAQFAQQAKKFAEKYRDFDHGKQLRTIVDRVAGLALSGMTRLPPNDNLRSRDAIVKAGRFMRTTTGKAELR